MFTEVSKSDIPNLARGKKMGYATPTLREFCESGIAAAVVNFPDKKTDTVYLSLKKAQELENLPVDVIRRRGKVYLIRMEED